MPTVLPIATDFTGAAVTEAQLKTALTSQRAALAEIGDPMGRASSVQNLSLAFTVGASALTINLKTRAGAAPSATDPLSIAFRNVTLDTPDFNVRNIIAALSVVVSSGSTLGHINAVAAPVYVYALDNAGAVELAVSHKFFGSQVVVSTTAEGGAGAADSATVMYSTAARSNVIAVCLGRWKSTQTSAGTWAATTGEKQLYPFPYKAPSVQVFTTPGANTYTRPWDLLSAKVTVVAGGGGGGGSQGTGAGQTSASGGGGGGGTSIKTIAAASLGATETVTVGAGGTAGALGGGTGGTGGTSSVGSHCSATGGAGGGQGTVQNDDVTGAGGGAGGVGSSGDINIKGGGGGNGINFATVTNTAVGGIGGSSTLGGGGEEVATAATTVGAAGGNYGGGASGSSAGASQAAGVAGSVGGGGIGIVEEFF